jgi:UDP-glucose 4-epimerase
VGKRQSMSIYGTDYPTKDGTGVRDYIHVVDLADAHLKALNYLRNGGDPVILNCGYGHGYSVREVLDTVKQVSHVDFVIMEEDRRPGDPACLIAQADKIGDLLEWKPKYDDLELIVRTAYGWEKKLINGEGYE